MEAFLYKPDGSMDVAKLRRQVAQHLEQLSSLLANELLEDAADDDEGLSDGEREGLYQREAFFAGLFLALAHPRPECRQADAMRESRDKA